MMQRPTDLTNNASWFMASLGLAFIVWLIATSQTDPIVQDSFTGIPVQVIQAPGMLVTNTASIRRTVTVNVRARQSVMTLLTNEDIVVQADLTGYGPGTQFVQLVANVSQSRQATADTKPSQLTFVLERESREQKPVEISILGDPPAGFIAGTRTTSETQVLVTGVASKVLQVDRLEAQVDLSDRRTTFSEEVELIPVDADGIRITDVTVAQPVRVTIEIAQDDAVEVVFVTPNIDRASLPPGYIYQGVIDYNPKTVSVTGSESSLAALPETLQTQQIDLSNFTASGAVNVDVILPDGISLVEPGQWIEVQIGIEPREEIRQINEVSVQVVGRNPDTRVRIVPSVVTVLVRGPQPLVQDLTVNNVSVTIDVHGLEVGDDYDLIPITTVSGVALNGDAIPPENISVLPVSIAVAIDPLVEGN